MITFIVPVGNEQVYAENFLASPLFEREADFQVLAQRGFATAGQAFNDGLARAHYDLVVCVHQDVVLPAGWARTFLAAFAALESGGALGVVGCVGITARGERAGHIYRHDRDFRPEPPLPAQIETADEMLIAFRRSSGLQFDPLLPGFFYYAVDICLEARSRGLRNFAVDVPCFHQAKNRNHNLPREFYISQEYMIAKWKRYLPVRTLSGTLGGKPTYWAQRLRQLLFKAVGYSPRPWWQDLPRITPSELLRDTGQRDLRLP